MYNVELGEAVLPGSCVFAVADGERGCVQGGTA